MLQIQKATIEDFSEIHNSYMLKQFPASELKNIDDFIHLLTDSRCSYYFYLAKDDQTTVGYVLLYKGCNFIWIDYIAVLPEFYSKGYGKKIIESLKNNFANINGLYFEVEKPDVSDFNTVRRIKFYSMCGAKKLDCNYYYPNNDGAIPMDLFFLSVNNTSLSRTTVLDNIAEVFQKLHFMCPHAKEILNRIN